MSMSHKAYAFDWHSFDCDLHRILIEALETNNSTDLEKYVDQNLNHVVDPYEGEPLTPNWRDSLGTPDIHEYGDYALTHFYDPIDDWGIGDEWLGLGLEFLESMEGAVLGFSVGPPNNLFDPGKYGSFFQTPEQVRESLSLLKPIQRPELASFLKLLKSCVRKRCGVYVTF